MWFPGSQMYYNEVVPGDVVAALGREYRRFSVGEAIQHPGIPVSARYDDVRSASLLVRPALQSYSVMYREYAPQVVQLKQNR